MGIRAKLKRIVPETLWPFFRKIDKYVIDATYLYLSQKRSFQRSRIDPHHCFQQQIKVFSTDLYFGESGSQLETSLLNAGFKCKSGRHSVYVWRQEDINRIHPNITISYPDKSVGLKIVKSRQIAPDNTPYYTSSLLAPASSKWSMKAVGSMEEKKAVSNLLHLSGVAPRVYDIVKLESMDGSSQFAYVLQHIEGEIVHGEKGKRFICDFKKALSEYGMETISISEHSDLRPPDFRDNIVTSDAGTYYVDIQNFVLGDITLIRDTEKMLIKHLNDLFNKSQYVIVADKTERIDWERYSRFNQTLFSGLAEVGVEVNQSVFFFAPRCVLQLSTLFALYRGALWCYLGDDMLKKWLFINGCTRFSCFTDVKQELLGINRHPTCLSRIFVSHTGESINLPQEKKETKDILLVVQQPEREKSAVDLRQWKHFHSIKIEAHPGEESEVHFFQRFSVGKKNESSF